MYEDEHDKLQNLGLLVISPHLIHVLSFISSGRRGSNPQNLLDGSQVLYQLSYVRMHYIV